MRYAVSRRQAQTAELQLREERLLAAENSRIERGLLPKPLLHTDFVTCASHYRPGRARAVLGGDFYDVVETQDGDVRMVIGDVMGHGPDEAALGVHLRVAWRGLVLAGVPDDQVLATLSHLLEAETNGGIFVTLCDVTVNRQLEVTARVAGHPPPLVCSAVGASYLDVEVGPPLGVHLSRQWPISRSTIAPGSSLVVYTDGLLDAYRQPHLRSSVGLDELLAIASDSFASGQPVDAFLESVIRDAPVRAADDTAIVVLTVGDPRS